MWHQKRALDFVESGQRLVFTRGTDGGNIGHHLQKVPVSRWRRVGQVGLASSKNSQNPLCVLDNQAKEKMMKKADTSVIVTKQLKRNFKVSFLALNE